MVYWDQGGLTNFLFGPSTGARILPAPAWQLKTPEGLAKFQTENNITITPEEAAAILALDPLVLSPTQVAQAAVGPFAYPTLPKRFIPINQPSLSLPSGLSAGFSVTRDEVVSADSQSCSLSNSVSDTDSIGLTQKLAVKAGETLLGFVVGDAVGGGKIGDAIGGEIKNISPAQIFGQTKTTVTVGLNSCKGLGHLSQNTETQNAFLKDTNTGINVAPYYDAFFGTIAYVPLPAGMGVLNDDEVLSTKTPNFVYNVPARLNSDLRVALPSDLTPQLRALGHATLKPAPVTSYIVPRNTVKGLPTGLQLDSLGNVSGKLGIPQNSQALYFVQDVLGKTVALLWVNVTTGF
jgi:hypothetical protein